MKTNQITARALINLIPEELFVELGAEHHVDYQVKKLFGLRIFNLLRFQTLVVSKLKPNFTSDDPLAYLYSSARNYMFEKFGFSDSTFNQHTGKGAG